MHLVLLTNFNLSGYALYHLSNNRSLEFCLPSDVSHIYTNATSPDLKKSSKMAKTVSWTLASALKPKLPLSSVRKNWYIPSFFIISSKTKPAMYCRPASVTKLIVLFPDMFTRYGDLSFIDDSDRLVIFHAHRFQPQFLHLFTACITTCSLYPSTSKIYSSLKSYNPLLHRRIFYVSTSVHYSEIFLTNLYKFTEPNIKNRKYFKNIPGSVLFHNTFLQIFRQVRPHMLSGTLDSHFGHIRLNHDPYQILETRLAGIPPEFGLRLRRISPQVHHVCR